MPVFLLLLGLLQAAPQTFFTSTLPPEEMRDKQAVLETSMGEIVLDLLPEAAPNHVAYFMTKAREGELDGTAFHRVIAMGMIQGGDPLTKDSSQSERFGTGGLGVLRFEASDEPMTRGAVAAVLRPNDRDSAGTQFFIVITDQPQLNGQYTVFARVAEGINVAQQISNVMATDMRPAERIELRRVTIRDKPAPPPEPFVDETVEELSQLRAVIQTTLGDITLEFFPDRAPEHVRNFLRHASTGLYDTTAFHRVAKGFVIQGGYLPMRREPPSERQTMWVRNLQPEFSPTPHERGTLSMARGDDPASATTSFFIVLERNQGLDNQYTVFGRVVDGMDVVDRIEQVPVNGEEPVERIEVTGVRIIRP